MEMMVLFSVVDLPLNEGSLLHSKRTIQGDQCDFQYFSFLPIHVFIHYTPLEKKYKNRSYHTRRTYGQTATLKCATVARGTLKVSMVPHSIFGPF